jgi:DNA-binding GntR family transcriptional regulator
MEVYKGGNMSTEDNVPSITADRLAGVYIKLRNKREELKRVFDEQDNALKEKMEMLKREMLKICTAQNANSINTPHGTVIRAIRTRYWTSDWSSMHNFILEKQLPQLLENRISQKNMKTYLEEHPDEHPAGLNVDNVYDVTVRKV